MNLLCPRCKTVSPPNAHVCDGCGVTFAVQPIQQKIQLVQQKKKISGVWIVLITFVSLSCIVIVSILGILYFAKIGRDARLKEEAANVPKTGRKYAEVGMGYTSLLKFCGDPDYERSYTSERGRIDYFTYTYSEQRNAKNCVGIFTINEKGNVESISR